MRFSKPSDIKNAVLSGIAILIVAAATCIIFETCRHTQPGDLESYVESSTRKMAENDTRYSMLVDEISKARTETAYYKGLCQLDFSMFENGEQVKAFEFLRRCLMKVHTDKDLSIEKKRFEIHCYLMLGSACDEMGLMSMSQSYYIEGLKKIDAYGIEDLRGDFLNNVGVSILRTGNNKEAMHYFNKAISAAEKLRNGYLLSVIYTNLAEVKNLEKEYDNAIDCALKALGYLDSKKDANDYYSVQNAIGNLYINKGDINLAISYIRNAYNYHLKGANNYYLFEECLSLAKAYIKGNMTDSVGHYLAFARKIADESGNPAQLQNVMKMQADMLLAANNPTKALELKDSIIALKDSVYNADNATRIREADIIYNIEHESQSAEKGMHAWNPVIVFISMSCLVGAILLMMVWMLMMHRRNDSLNRQKTEALADFASLQQKLLDEEKEKNRKFEEDINENNRKLTSFTLSHIQTNQKVESAETALKKMLLEISQRDHKLRDSIKSVISTLTTLKVDAQWDEFHYYFDNVHPGFYASLDTLHPGLTQKDRRLCALISLGLSNKEIAGITFREVRSVETSRTRLRKKLGLESDSQLNEYITGLTRTATGSSIMPTAPLQQVEQPTVSAETTIADNADAVMIITTSNATNKESSIDSEA